MKILEALTKRHDRRPEAQPIASSPGEAAVPISGYDQLDEKQVSEQLSHLSQVELAGVETYERAHGNRPAVLDKLRYMQGSEPVPDYDALTPEQIGEALAGADSETVRAVRDYERKFRGRRAVLDEAARVLPIAPQSAAEERTRKQKATLLREGYADRARTAPDAPE